MSMSSNIINPMISIMIRIYIIKINNSLQVTNTNSK